MFQSLLQITRITLTSRPAASAAGGWHGLEFKANGCAARRWVCTEGLVSLEGSPLLRTSILKLFITGAAGRLGKPIVKHFMQSHDVVAFDRMDAPGDWPDDVPYVQADLLDPSAVRTAAEGANAVIHLGAIPGRMHSIPQSEIFNINVQGTYHVLEAAQRTGAKIVLLASSLCAIGFPEAVDKHALSYLPLDEDHPCRPRHAYDLSKQQLEITARYFTDRMGITTLCFRLPALFDVRQSPWLPFEVHSKPPRLPLADYMDISDAVRLFELALPRTDLGHEVFFATARTSLSAEPTPEYIKRFDPPLEWRGPSPDATTPLIKAEKARTMLGFEPEITWQQGMADTPDIPRS